LEADQRFSHVVVFSQERLDGLVHLLLPVCPVCRFFALIDFSCAERRARTRSTLRRPQFHCLPHFASVHWRKRVTASPVTPIGSPTASTLETSGTHRRIACSML